MKKHFYFLILIFSYTNFVFSQRQLIWSDTVNSIGNHSEYYGAYDGNMIKLDGDKNIYTAILSDSSNLKRILISKHDSLGNNIWSTEFQTSPTESDWLSALAIDDSNNVFIGGSAGIASGQSKMMILKFNGINGQLKWVYYSPLIQNDYTANEIKFDAFGNIYACGKYYSNSTATYYYNVTKLDVSGNFLAYFNHSANTANYGYPNHMVLDSVGNIYITAQNKNLTTNSDDGALIKLDQNLSQIWIQTYDGPQGGNDYFYDPTGWIYRTLSMISRQLEY